MKEDYIKQVKRRLVVSRKQKNEIIRDLQEAFASALEHGETEPQVIERLGSPKDFSNTIHEQLGINCAQKEKRKLLIRAGMAVIAMAAAFIVAVLIQVLQAPANVIGQADAMTSIKIDGTAIDFLLLFLLFGIAAFIIATVSIIQYVHKIKE